MPDHRENRVGLTAPTRSLEEAVSEVERELAVRRRCYQRWCDDGKLSVVDARDRLERLAAARDYLRGQLESSETVHFDTPSTQAVLATVAVSARHAPPECV